MSRKPEGRMEWLLIGATSNPAAFHLVQPPNGLKRISWKPLAVMSSLHSGTKLPAWHKQSYFPVKDLWIGWGHGNTPHWARRSWV